MLKSQIKTASDLRGFIEDSGRESHFFDRDTMKFFGDTMKNFGVRKTVILASFDKEGNYHENGIERDVWELYRRKPVKHNNQKSAYFDPDTFRRVHTKA